MARRGAGGPRARLSIAVAAAADLAEKRLLAHEARLDVQLALGPPRRRRAGAPGARRRATRSASGSPPS